MDGPQLLLATHATLTSLGITSKLQRHQLLNRREELLINDDSQQALTLQHGNLVNLTSS